MAHVTSSKELINPGALPSEVVNAPVLAVMPSTNMAMARQAAALMESRAGVKPFQVLLVEDDAGLGFIHIANQVFKQTTGQYFIYTAQDAFAGRFWLKNALQSLQAQNKGLLAFNDGKWAGYLAAFGMVKRQWASQNYPDSCLFYPGYQSHYADTELTLLAMQTAQYCYDPNALLVEVDWEKDKKITNLSDKNLFALRKNKHFDDKVHQPELLHLFS